MMLYGLFGLVFLSIISIIAGFAWIYTTKYVLLERMAKIETDATRMAILESRLNAWEVKPDAASSAIKHLAEELSLVRSEIKGMKRDAEQTEESLRRLVNKMASRAKRDLAEDEKGASAVAVTPRATQQMDIEDLIRSGQAVPLAPQQHQQPVNNSFGKIAK